MRFLLVLAAMIMPLTVVGTLTGEPAQASTSEEDTITPSVNLAETSPGEVLWQGTPLPSAEGGCHYEPVSFTLQPPGAGINASGVASALLWFADDCTVQLEDICLTLDECLAIQGYGEEAAVPTSFFAPATQITLEGIEVLLPDGSDQQFHQCGRTDQVSGDVFTYGYPGKWDVLTQVEVSATYETQCSGGPYRGGSSGLCRWASWNGWEKEHCYWDNTVEQDYWCYAPQTGCDDIGRGVRGGFSCDNNNFCNSNHYEHELWLATAAWQGKHNGEWRSGGFCDLNLSGDVPPQPGSGHNKEYTCQGFQDL